MISDSHETEHPREELNTPGSDRPGRLVRQGFSSSPRWREQGRSWVKKKIDIARIPELGTRVGIQGSSRQKEVGGPVCFGIAVGILIALSGG